MGIVDGDNVSCTNDVPVTVSPPSKNYPTLRWSLCVCCSMSWGMLYQGMRTVYHLPCDDDDDEEEEEDDDDDDDANFVAVDDDHHSARLGYFRVKHF